MKPTIEVTVSPTGETTVEVNGVQGSGCEALSKPMEEALGVRTADKKKPEYQQQAKQANQQGQF